MAKIIQINRPTISRAFLRAQCDQMESDFELRAHSLRLLGQTAWRLAYLAPPARLEKLALTLDYIANGLDLTAENLKAVLLCSAILEEQFIRESG